MSTTDPMESAAHIVDDAWAELRKSLFVQQQRGEQLTKIPDISFAEAQRRSELGQSLLDRLDRLEAGAIPHDTELTLRLVRFRASTWAKEADFYWHVIDPLGIGFFGMFLPTAYCGGFLLNYIHRQFSGFSFDDDNDCDHYRELIRDYGRLIDAFTDRTIGQADRGIRMPKSQIVSARGLVNSLCERAPECLAVVPNDNPEPAHGGLGQDISKLVVERVQPAFARLLALLSEQYYSRAPQSVGIGQYPGGREIYEHLVKLHTTMSLTSETVHMKGLDRMDAVQAEMDSICKQVNSDRSEVPFPARLMEDPEWRSTSAEGISAVFQRYMDRLTPNLPDLFEKLPVSPCQVAPLPEALQSNMTFGYYEGPRQPGEPGTYFFNTANLSQRPLIRVGALAYHELIPGHHVHFAGQLENTDLHPFRAHSFVNAYNEGWAEYAIAVAEELGMFELPEERYGRLTHEAALIARLVVDTGMNALGWSLEKSRHYLQEHTQMSEDEIASETLRYSCDLPGQSLAYKIGDEVIFALRKQMKEALKEHFNLRTFHSCILGPGALPLPDLEWHIETKIGRLRQQTSQGSSI